MYTLSWHRKKPISNNLSLNWLAAFRSDGVITGKSNITIIHMIR